LSAESNMKKKRDKGKTRKAKVTAAAQEVDLTGIDEISMGYLGHAITTLEQYDGNGKYKVAMFKAIRAANDVVHGGEREFIRFFLKRACALV